MAATAHAGSAIEVDALVVCYGSTTAVDGVTLTVDAGEVVALLGPNGAGKTSTVETLEGFRRPDGGTVRVLGLDPVGDHARLVARMGVMLQGGGVYPGIRPPEALELFAAYHDDPAPPAELADRLGLAGLERTPWRALSGGEQQRLSLALALVGRPDVVFLDEPTSGVDPAGRRAIREVVGDLRARGVAVLLTSHDLEEVERVADRVAIIDAGRLLAHGTPEALRHGARAELRFNARARIAVDELAHHLGLAPGAVSEVEPGSYVVAAAPDPARVAALTAWLAQAGVNLDALHAGEGRLEDVYLRLLGGSHRHSSAEPRAVDAPPTRAPDARSGRRRDRGRGVARRRARDDRRGGGRGGGSRR